RGSARGGVVIVADFAVLAPQHPAHPDHLADAHEHPRGDARVDVADLAGLFRGGESLDVARDDARVVQPQGLGRNELGLADDSVQRGVLRREPEEGAETLALDVDATRRPGGRLGHGVPHAAVEVFHELLEDLEFAREVEVERALRDAGGLGDAHDGCLRVPALGEYFFCSFEEFRAWAGSPGPSRCERHEVPSLFTLAPLSLSRRASNCATSSRRRTLFAPDRGMEAVRMMRLGTL